MKDRSSGTAGLSGTVAVVNEAIETETDIARFAIGFDHRDRARLHELWEQALDSERWSDGPITEAFETAWAGWNGLPAVATSSWSGSALAALEYAGVRGETVLCPSNTFMATPLAILAAGGRVEFVDCNRDDLCASYADFEEKLYRTRPKAAFLVHIGGHIAFEAQRIADLCRAEGVFLIEDCAHAHGASWSGRRAGTYGDAGVWSFAPTKTISTGEGGMLVSGDPGLIEFAHAFRSYGKPDHAVDGLNYRMNEFTAALGLLGVERLDEIVAWKNETAREHARPGAPVIASSCRRACSRGSTSTSCSRRSSGRPERSTRRRVTGSWVTTCDLPNTDWVAENHWCVPLYYRPSSTEDAQ